jgi:anti-sigma regulatory factor (Ser/Thr protein kinase)
MCRQDLVGSSGGISVQVHGFRHEALLYRGEEEFLAGTLAFIRDAVWAGEPVLVAVSEAKGDALRSRLNGEGEAVCFTDMCELGRNPARIIPAWREFVREHGATGRPLRGIGEPVWPGRSSAELVECQHHESLLNLAFADARGFWLLCPYDTDALAAGVLDAARRSHPFVAEDDTSRRSDVYLEPGQAPGPFDGELPPPSGRPDEMVFDLQRLRAVRRFVSERAARADLAADRAADFVVAVNELATNSVLHADGGGTVRVWLEQDVLLCEVRDTGRLRHPLAGRERPTVDQASGRGLWLVNHLIDLVQIRSLPNGNVVRLHMSV